MPFLRGILQEKWFFSVALHRQERAQVLMNVQKVGDSVANILGQVATLALKSLTFNSPALQPGLFFSRSSSSSVGICKFCKIGEQGAGSAGQQQQVQMCVLAAERAAE